MNYLKQNNLKITFALRLSFDVASLGLRRGIFSSRLALFLWQLMERGALGVSGRTVVSPVALDFNGVIATARDRRLAATPVQEAQWKQGTAIRIHVKVFLIFQRRLR